MAKSKAARSAPVCPPEMIFSSMEKNRVTYVTLFGHYVEPIAVCGQGSGLEKYRRHIFLCADQTEPHCAPMGKGPGVLGVFEARLKELNLGGPEPMVYRSKANCLRVCIHGPIAVVYPEAVCITPATPSAGAHHPGAFDRRKSRGGICFLPGTSVEGRSRMTMTNDERMTKSEFRSLFQRRSSGYLAFGIPSTFVIRHLSFAGPLGPMMALYSLLADAILLLHALIVSFQCWPLPVIWLGYFRNWSFVRSFAFRVAHLLLIASSPPKSVLVRSAADYVGKPVAPQSRLDPRYPGGYVAHWVHGMLVYDVDQRVFTIGYVSFLVLSCSPWSW